MSTLRLRQLGMVPWFGACLTLLLISLASSSAQGVPSRDGSRTDVHAIARRVDGHYNALHAMQVEFVETFRGAGMDRTESGTLWIRRPGNMRWEYRQPRAKLFITDGKTAWFYAPGDRQARRTDRKSTRLNSSHLRLSRMPSSA